MTEQTSQKNVENLLNTLSSGDKVLQNDEIEALCKTVSSIKTGISREQKIELVNAILFSNKKILKEQRNSLFQAAFPILTQDDIEILLYAVSDGEIGPEDLLEIEGLTRHESNDDIVYPDGYSDSAHQLSQKEIDSLLPLIASTKDAELNSLFKSIQAKLGSNANVPTGKKDRDTEKELEFLLNVLSLNDRALSNDEVESLAKIALSINKKISREQKTTLANAILFSNKKLLKEQRNTLFEAAIPFLSPDDIDILLYVVSDGEIDSADISR